MKISTTLAFSALAVLASVGILSADQNDGRGYRGNYYNGRSYNNDCGCSTCKPACNKPVCCQPTAPPCCRPYQPACAPAPKCEPVKKCCGPQTAWECPKACCTCNGNHSGYSYDSNRGHRTRYIDTTYSMDSHNQRFHDNSSNNQQVAMMDQNAYGPSRPFAQPASGNMMSDDSITQAITAALRSDRSLSDTAKNIKINVSNGVVTLSGSVANEADKARIGSMAQINGVTSVSNEIKVQ